MNAIEDQPAPVAADRQPIWPMVIKYVELNYTDDESSEIKAVSQLVQDMAKRHQVGIARYGVPLTSGNGRNSLVDAYQELLDFVVYARTWLDERGIVVVKPGVVIRPSDGVELGPDGLSAVVVDEARFLAAQPPNIVESMMINMFCAATSAVLDLRGALTMLELGIEPPIVPVQPSPEVEDFVAEDKPS